MKHRTATLEGALLDAAVAMAEGIEIVQIPRADGSQSHCRFDDDRGEWMGWNPSTDWRDGGPIIERERISVIDYSGGEGAPCWTAYVGIDLARGEICGCKTSATGSTILIAAMRAHVASELGEEVELP